MLQKIGKATKSALFRELMGLIGVILLAVTAGMLAPKITYMLDPWQQWIGEGNGMNISPKQYEGCPTTPLEAAEVLGVYPNAWKQVGKYTWEATFPVPDAGYNERRSMLIFLPDAKWGTMRAETTKDVWESGNFTWIPTHQILPTEAVTWSMTGADGKPFRAQGIDARYAHWICNPD